MKSAFLTEMPFEGRIGKDHNNMRTEFAWMHVLGADHFNIHSYEKINGYDVVFIIFPKATVKLNAVGVEMLSSGTDKDITIYEKPVVETLKKSNKMVCNIQEGPSWFFNEYELPTQFNFFNQLSECSILFAHNEYDANFYRGLFPESKVEVIPSLMIDPHISSPRENKAIIGGNFARWYGGFQSYIVASEFQCPIFVPASHCKRRGEQQVPNLTHLTWVMWNDWMKQLSSFSYAVNLMPTVAAGTFSMNCAYFGIPCIGNEKVDTQRNLFPKLSVDVNDIATARELAARISSDIEFYEETSGYARKTLHESRYLDQRLWLEHMNKALNG